MSEIKYLKYRWYVLATMLIATAATGMVLIAPSPLVGNISEAMGLDLGVVTGSAMLPFTLFVAIGSIIYPKIVVGISQSNSVNLYCNEKNFRYNRNVNIVAGNT
ncbi:hypothetical protein [Parasporobacterium paucivorans]|uniref:MatE protein n=1 Tax=Parasporobacterium paucivorans DSM 15970 TaxID=1122934 RepID=A0A1M6IEN3_9FIRM|nr:hypothetical protein [Parasporobacterium paucivorans]SHJ32927.1 hypothetical protein SAMN02745691_01746 [Parasporobacterium paucivorans DSM 15970]